MMFYHVNDCVLHGGEGEGVHGDGVVRSSKKWICIENVPFPATYQRFKVIASKIKKWEPKTDVQNRQYIKQETVNIKK